MRGEVYQLAASYEETLATDWHGFPRIILKPGSVIAPNLYSAIPCSLAGRGSCLAALEDLPNGKIHSALSCWTRAGGKYDGSDDCIGDDAQIRGASHNYSPTAD
jgi:hypothetical protein